MELQQEQKEINNIPWKILIPYKIIGYLFAITALSTFFLSILAPRGIRTFSLILYIIIFVTVAIGFLKMRKWIITLQGAAVILAVGKVIIDLLRGTLKANILITLLIFSSLFLFAYLTRSYLKGGYEKVRIVVFYATLSILSYLLIFLSK